MIALNQCTEITPEQYLELVNPEFVGQTKIDSNKMYWMVFKIEGIFYKIHNKLQY